MVRDARRQRRLTDGRLTDWVVVRNRCMLGSRNKRLIGEGLTELAKRIGFRWVDGFAERVIYREFFLRSLTALDDINKATLGTRPNKSHVAARGEVIALSALGHKQTFATQQPVLPWSHLIYSILADNCPRRRFAFEPSGCAAQLGLFVSVLARRCLCGYFVDLRLLKRTGVLQLVYPRKFGELLGDRIITSGTSRMRS